MRKATKTLRPEWAHVSVVHDANLDVPTIRTPEDVKAIVRRLLHRDREFFVTIYLNTRNYVLRAELTSLGTVNASLVHPREVFTMACLCKAASVILVHNHPSGDPAPSREDLMLTKRLRSAGEILGIDVLDHVIVSPTGEHYSFAENKML
jgi:DNA repair protein RadC